MEEEEEEVMSEVHVGCPPRQSVPYISHFTFPLPLPSSTVVDRCNDQIQVEASVSPMPTLDGDGDLALSRRNFGSVNDELQEETSSSPMLNMDDDDDLALSHRKRNSTTCLNCSLTIQHTITSSLPSVGLQVWMAELVLTDFVLHKTFNSSDFNGIIALELGAGTGLVGIALSLVATTVFLTDRGSNVLDNCATNAQLNSSLSKGHKTDVRVKELDWQEPWPPIAQTCNSPSQRPSYSWTSSEIEAAERATVLFAADVIYSDELTDSFFCILEKLMTHGSEKILYLALEKRYNFSLNDLDVVANGYAHFRSFFKNEEGYEKLEDNKVPCFIGNQMDLSQLPQYIREYERGNNVELWKITYCTTALL